MVKVFQEICQQRRSVRGFLPKQVDSSILQAIFTLAQTTPSSCNTQPWRVHVVSGDACQALRKKFVAAMNEGAYKPDFDHSMTYEGVYRERQFDAAAQLYNAIGVERKDKVGRHQAFLRNFEFFDAPHVAFVGMDEGFGLREAVDMGMYAQTLMLALTAHGLASCPQNSLSFNGDLLREELKTAASWRVLFGISFGYEDTSAAANTARVGRAALDENIVFHS